MLFSMTSASPSVIWHITRDGTPARPGTAPGSERFVHCSFSEQLAGTLALHFAGVEQVVLLRLDPARLGTRLVLEPSRDGALFPHVYGEIEAADILESVTLRRGADGRFDLSGLA